MDDYTIIGKVLKPQALKGEVRVGPITRDATQYLTYDYLYIGDNFEKYDIDYCRLQDGFVIVKFTAINDAIEEINIYKDMDLIENLNGLLSGDVLTVSVKIPEDYKEEKQCLIAGFYKSGKLVGTEINSETQKDELGFINHKLTLPDTTEFDSVKIFLWNSETGMIPLRNSKYYA